MHIRLCVLHFNATRFEDRTNDFFDFCDLRLPCARLDVDESVHEDDHNGSISLALDHMLFGHRKRT